VQGHTYRIALLDETLVVPAERDKEQDRRDVLEAVYPLAALGLLAADVDHDKLLPGRAGHCKVHLGDAHRPCARKNDVLRGKEGGFGISSPRSSYRGRRVGWESKNRSFAEGMTQQGRRTSVEGT